MHTCMAVHMQDYYLRGYNHNVISRAIPHSVMDHITFLQYSSDVIISELLLCC